MVNPVLTLLFNLFLVGAALTVIAAMAQEYLESRTPSVGGRSGQVDGLTEHAQPSAAAGRHHRLNRAA